MYNIHIYIYIYSHNSGNASPERRHAQDLAAPHTHEGGGRGFPDGLGEQGRHGQGRHHRQGQSNPPAEVGRSQVSSAEQQQQNSSRTAAAEQQSALSSFYCMKSSCS